MYDATLAIVPAARFKLAGLDPVIVREASIEHMESAHVFGRQLGMSSVTIFHDTMRAKATYLRAHSGPGNASAKFDALRKDVNQCLGDDFGRYND